MPKKQIRLVRIFQAVLSYVSSEFHSEQEEEEKSYERQHDEEQLPLLLLMEKGHRVKEEEIRTRWSLNRMESFGYVSDEALAVVVAVMMMIRETQEEPNRVNLFGYSKSLTRLNPLDLFDPLAFTTVEESKKDLLKVRAFQREKKSEETFVARIVR